MLRFNKSLVASRAVQGVQKDQDTEGYPICASAGWEGSVPTLVAETGTKYSWGQARFSAGQCICHKRMTCVFI